jgi:hypothetical protein
MGNSMPSAKCPTHNLELTIGSTATFFGEQPRQHLVCPTEGCTVMSGKICPKCWDIIPTYRKPELDAETATPGLIFAAWLCPACEYNAFEVEVLEGNLLR